MYERGGKTWRAIWKKRKELVHVLRMEWSVWCFFIFKGKILNRWFIFKKKPQINGNIPTAAVQLRTSFGILSGLKYCVCACVRVWTGLRACLFPIWSRCSSCSHISFPLSKKCNSLHWSSLKLKEYETLQISVSSVSRFEPCKFPSRTIRFFLPFCVISAPAFHLWIGFPLFFSQPAPLFFFSLSFHLQLQNLGVCFARATSKCCFAVDTPLRLVVPLVCSLRRRHLHAGRCAMLCLSLSHLHL